MFGARRWDRAETLRALAITFAGVLAFHLVLYRSHLVDVVFDTADSWQYLDLARAILRGSFAENGVTTMNRTPGYPGFLALLFAIFGDSQRAVVGVQMVLDTLAVVCVVHVAIRLGLSRRAVATTAILAGTCVYTACFSYQAMTETLYTITVTASLWALVPPLDASPAPPYGTTPRRAAVAGLLLGIGVLTRPALAPAALLVVVAVVALAASADPRAALRVRALWLPTCFSMGLLVAVVPWMIRNYVVFHDEFTGPHAGDVSLLGRKCSIPNNAHFYTKQLQRLLLSYEEPYVQIGPFQAPDVARYVYAGERDELSAALSGAGEDFAANGRFTDAPLAAFTRIADKRFAAAPRLRVTAPVSKMAKIWVTPRASVLWWNRSGAELSRAQMFALTGYNLVYVLMGLLGAWIALRRVRVREVPAFVGAMMVGHTWVYAIWLPFPLSRYAVPLFPMLSLCAGFAVERARRSASAGQAG